MRTLAAIAVLLAVVAIGAAPHAAQDADSTTTELRVAAPAPEPSPAKTRRRPVPIGSRAATLARNWLGVGYSWGGASPASGFDCSGFTSYVYRRLGVDLPHNAAAQFSTGRSVPRTRLRPGDLLFFRGLGHVGMYVGRGRMIHSPQSGEAVRIDRLGIDYGGVLVGARRITRAQTTHN